MSLASKTFSPQDNGDCKTLHNGNGVDPSQTPLMDRETLQEQFEVSEEFGFAAKYPLVTLPEYFQPWTDIAVNLQQLIEQKKIREAVDKLPLLDHNRLATKAEWCVAHMFLAYIAQGYVWQDGEEGITKVLPKNIAIPFHACSEKLKIPANFNQFNSVLVNWKLKDHNQGFTVENMDTIITLIGGDDEVWFFMTAFMVEKACGPALYAIADAQQAVSYQDDSKLESALRVIEEAVHEMVVQLNRMGDGNNPSTFYNVLRPFIAGWNAPAFKEKGLDGLIYEGVSDKPVSYPGGTAAESATLPALDAALGISHRSEDEILCEDFKKYMPPKHREFLIAITKGPSIRKYVLSKENPDLTAAYNGCLEVVKLFRNTHLQVVTRYIVLPSRQSTSGQGKGLVGTGGTGFMQFLKGLRDSTLQAFIGKDSHHTPATDGFKNKITSFRFLTIAGVISVTGAICLALFRKYH
ncbi:Indoleamine 2,3-dioxygenase 1 [Holothuria leucospilota]|uniref:Indoleamine 2,3-dioxygenase 1 n=1 Tax=Holothuria leucospilota TaxID=206669 RepID=A0A9Q1C301_HOLLE|nr:Indoleamine 2,3-dioxygenase 1 [Holothuria leucospilota]